MSEPINNFPTFPQYSEFSEQWTDILNHLNQLCNEGNVFGAMQYIMTSVMPDLSNYTENYQFVQQGDIESALSELNQGLNLVQQDFNNNQGGASSSSAKDALQQYWGTNGKGNQNGIYYFLQQGEKNGIFSSTFVKSIESEFNTIFYSSSSSDLGKNPPGDNLSNDASNVAHQWHKDWKATTLSSSSSSNGDASLQAVTNALTAVGNNFSSQAATAQSKLQYYQSNDQQYNAMDHDLMTDWVNQENQMVTAMQSEGS